MSSSIFLTASVGASSFFFLSICEAVAFHFYIPLSLLLFGNPLSTISSALLPTKINMRCCLFIFHLLSSSPLNMREVGMMKQQVKKRRRQKKSVYLSTDMFSYTISLSIFNQIWSKSLRPGHSRRVVDKQEIF